LREAEVGDQGKPAGQRHRAAFGRDGVEVERAGGGQDLVRDERVGDVAAVVVEEDRDGGLAGVVRRRCGGGDGGGDRPGVRRPPGDLPPQAQDWARPADRAEVAEFVKRFGTPLLDIVGLVDATRDCLEFPMCDRDPLPYWTRGRVTLLGDAAHPMYPMGSNGAGQAIMDAVSLGGQLARHADPVAALVAYQDERLARPTRIEY
jgi:hypothetical protein